MPKSQRPLGATVALFGAAAVALGSSTDRPPTDASTQEMTAVLREQAAKVDPLKLPFLVDERRAEILAEQLTWPRPTAERLGLRMSHAMSLLQAGRLQDALDALAAIEADARSAAPASLATHHPLLRFQEAVAYLRMGEEQNCHLGNRDSCLLPIKGGGVHRKREGSTKAIEILESILAQDAHNLRARWLLNVAHMTLGTYPDGVPARHLIPPTAFAPDHPLPRFDNVAQEVGIDEFGLAGGAILDDFDNDGLLDLAISHSGFEDQLHLYRNQGDGTFKERSAEARLTGETGGLNLSAADYDNDGFLDILVLRGGWMGSEGKFPMSLIRNLGDGTFTDVTRSAGLFRLAPTQTAVWFDFNGDGWLDLFVGNESRPEAEPEDIHPCELYRNNRDGTFTDVAREAGVDVKGFVKGVVSGDYDRDGRPDLYVSVIGADSLLFRNEGPGRDGSGWSFVDVAPAAGVTKRALSFGAFFFDYDNDGWPDLFVTGYGNFLSSELASDTAADYLGLPNAAEKGRLYRNRGDGTFEDTTTAAGLYRVVPAMGLNFGDIDTDGWLDIYLGTGNPDLGSLIPNRMFRNAEGRFFQDVTTAGNFGHLQKGHGVAFGDVDNDGDQDVFETMGGAFQTDNAWSALYLNPGNRNHWLRLELQGVTSNRDAVGAQVKVTLETRSGQRSVHRTVGPGGSFGASPRRLEIGLGDARRIVSVEVFWPVTGRTQKLTGLALDRGYSIVEGSPELRPADRRSFRMMAPTGR